MPSPAGPDDAVTTVSTNHDDLLQLLLEICEDFFTQTNEASRDQLDDFLRARGITGGPGWLVDMLALTRLRLQNPTPPSDLPPTPEALTSGIAPHRHRSAEENP